MWENTYDLSLFISEDVETDGPKPFKNNVLSLGAVAYVTDVYVVNKRLGVKCRGLRRFTEPFSQNIKNQSGAMPDEATMMNFWHKDEHHMALYQATRQSQMSVEMTLQRFDDWLDRAKYWAAGGRYRNMELIPVARPGPFDFYWVSALYDMTGRKNPFVRKGLDMQSYLMGARGVSCFREAAASTWKDSWNSPDFPHTHIAVDDAYAQGEIFRAMYEETLNRGPRSRYALKKLREKRAQGVEW